MPPPHLLNRISAPTPDHDYPMHSPPHSPVSHNNQLPLSRPSLLQALTIANLPLSPSPPLLPDTDRLSVFDKRWPALFGAGGANGRSETSSNPPAPFLPSSQGPRPNTPQDSFDKLVYPSTEAHSASVSADTEPSVAADTELLTPLRDCIASFDSTAAQQSKILNSIILLEQDLQNIADRSSLDLDKARRAEALAQNSLITAKEAVAFAQENASVALATKDRVDQALIRLAQLRSHCANETSTATGEQALTDLKYNLESVYQVISRQAKDNVPVPPTGLSRNVLSTMAAEMTRKTELLYGSRKRKRCQDDDDPVADSDLPYQPSKEARIEQHVFPSVGPSVESLADAAREAWNQEADRRSVILPGAVARTVSDQQGQKLAAESHASDAQQIEEDIPRQSAQGPATATQASEHTPALSPRQDPLPPSEPNMFKQDASCVAGPEETEGSLQVQRRRELEQQKREITKFQMRERESQAQRKDTESKKVATPKLGDSNKRRNMLILPVVLGTEDHAPNEAHNAMQGKTGVSDNFRMVEQRLANEKQQAPMATRSSITQSLTPQSLIQKSNENDGQSASERRQQTQDSLQQLRDVEHGEERKIPDEAEERKTKMSMKTTMKALVERAKFKEQTNDGASKQSQPTTTMAPSVGNVFAQQTVTGSPVKESGKKSCSPRVPATATRLSSAQVSSSTSPRKGTNLLPPSFQPTFIPLLPLNRENAPRNAGRQNSVPPIEYIHESSGDPVPGMKNAATSLPLAQAHDTSPPKATMGTSVSQEAQEANLKFTPDNTEQITTPGHKATLPPASINDIVPKAELLSPTITNTPIIQHPLPQRPSNSNIHSTFTAPQPNAPQGKGIQGIPSHPLSAVATIPQDNISQLRNENAGHRWTAAAANSGSNTSPLSPLTSTLPSRARMDLARDPRLANNEIGYASRQSNSPPLPLFVAEQPTIPSSSHSYRSDARPSRGWAMSSSPRHIGAKRPRYREAPDNDDERHWSPPRHQTRRIPRNDTYIPRTPSGSPPAASHESTPTHSHRPLSKRIEGAYDPAPQNSSDHPADRHVQEWSDTSSYYPSRRALVDRFWADEGDIRGAQPPRRPRTGKHGRGGLNLRLEERIT